MSTVAPPQHVNVLFRGVIVATVLFVVTLLAIIATLFGDPAAAKSPAEAFLNAYGWRLCGLEVAAIVVLGIAAMAVDRRQSVRYQAGGETAPGPASPPGKQPGKQPGPP